MFFKLLNKVRKMPEHSKRVITLFVSATVTAVIGIIWATSFIPYAGKAISETSMEQLATPFNKVSEIISGDYAGSETDEAERVADVVPPPEAYADEGMYGYVEGTSSPADAYASSSVASQADSGAGISGSQAPSATKSTGTSSENLIE